MSAYDELKNIILNSKFISAKDKAEFEKKTQKSIPENPLEDLLRGFKK